VELGGGGIGCAAQWWLVLVRAGQARGVVEVSEGRGEDQRKRSKAGSGWSGVDLRKAWAGFSRSWAGFSHSEGRL
jgi:hypothetical protein